VLVAAGQGWAFLPEIMLGDELTALNTPKDWYVTRQLGVVHHRERTLSNAGLAMLKLLEEQR
jgi:DNA-binding transcriptional LysR family regulator